MGAEVEALVRQLFSSDFMPHAYCLREPGLIGIHAAADCVIALSYLLIPAALLLLVRRRRDLLYPWIFTLFAIFILGCGATHVLAVVTLWYPIYRFDAALKILTALASLATAAMLFRLLPQLMLIPSPKQFHAQLEERELIGRKLGLMNERLAEAVAEAQAANHAKSTFLSTISHEIRTPLNAILGYAQLMQRDPAQAADAKANLTIIGRSGEHLLSLINNVLDMSKIEAGRAELNCATFNLRRQLDDLAAMFRLRALAKNLRFEMSVDEESTPYIRADEVKLRQTLINLLGNAIKFTKQGHVSMEVRTENRAAGRVWLIVLVEDSGLGMTDVEQEKLFEPFRQTTHGRNLGGGTGLGLAISRQHARLMGGELTVSSHPGQGSVFRFEIPIEVGDANAALEHDDVHRVIGICAGTSPRILVVDDQFENRDFLMKLLTTIGFSVRGADNGETALSNWRDWNPELILMDVQMPVMDGIEATRRIKSDVEGKETRIIILTASAMDDDRRIAEHSGADAFLAKPCRENELLEKMRGLLHITYDYEEPTGNPEVVPPLSVASLSRLPPELLQKLRDATLNGNKRLLNELILNVGAMEDNGCAQGLQALVDKYEYDALTQLLDEASQV